MKKAIFLDRDGTINVEKNYLFEIEKFEFLPGVLEGLKRLKDAGYLLIVLTNQSGIARGYYTEKQYKKLERWMLGQMKRAGAEIDGIYYCPHLPDAPLAKYRDDCSCRKPKLGMFEQAIREFNIDVANSVAIGDKMRDLTLCDNGVTQGYLLYAEGESKEKSTNIHYLSGGIAEAVDDILK